MRELVDLGEDLFELFAAGQSIELATAYRNQEKTFHMTIASFSKRAQRLSRSWALWRLMVVCTWMGMPASLAHSMAWMVRA